MKAKFIILFISTTLTSCANFISFIDRNINSEEEKKAIIIKENNRCTKGCIFARPSTNSTLIDSSENHENSTGN